VLQREKMSWGKLKLTVLLFINSDSTETAAISDSEIPKPTMLQDH
jgi:hypothetical protein